MTEFNEIIKIESFEKPLEVQDNTSNNITKPTATEDFKIDNKQEIITRLDKSNDTNPTNPLLEGGSSLESRKEDDKEEQNTEQNTEHDKAEQDIEHDKEQQNKEQQNIEHDKEQQNTEQNTEHDKEQQNKEQQNTEHDKEEQNTEHDKEEQNTEHDKEEQNTEHDKEEQETETELEEKQSEEPAIKDNLEEQDGGGQQFEPLEYKINYILPEDEKLINLERVKASISRYMDNIKTDDYKKYRQAVKAIYQKYSSKKFTIHIDEDRIIVSKVDKKKEIISELNKPKYIFYNKANNLYKMKTDISNRRAELLLEYQKLVSKLEVMPEEKKQFEKQRKSFIDLLERYYIYTTYHHYINNLDTDNKANIIVQEMRTVLKDNGEDSLVLEGNLYRIDNSLISSINEKNTERFNTYNELFAKLQSVNSRGDDKDSKKIKEDIKEYLKNKEEINKLYEEVKKVKKIQDIYIDYIVARIPSSNKYS
jgi:hypothetical protein